MPSDFAGSCETESLTSSNCADATACSSGTFGRPRRGNLSVNLLAEGFSDDTDGFRPPALKLDSCGSTTACGVRVRVLFWRTGTSSSTDEIEVVLLFRYVVGGEYATEGNAIEGGWGMSRGGDVAGAGGAPTRGEVDRSTVGAA